MTSAVLRSYRLVFWLFLVVLSIELVFEVRAHYRGHDALLFRMAERMSSSAHARGDGNSGWGPTDDFPFRSLVVPPEKEARVSRVWIASSSYAHDGRFPADQIFPWYLENRLRESGWPIQVLNAAEPGQSIEGNLAKLRKLGRVWKPDYVLLYQMNNDINEISKKFLAPQVAKAANGQGCPGEKGAQSSAAAGWVSRMAEETTTYQLLNFNVTARLSQARILAPEIGAQARGAFRKRIHDFIDLSRSLGASPVLCTFTTSHDRRHLASLPRDVKSSLLRYNEYLSISGWLKAIEDLNDDIRQIGQEKSVLVIDLNRQVDGVKYFRDFVHFTRDGHLAMAQSISRSLLENRKTIVGDETALLKP